MMKLHRLCLIPLLAFAACSSTTETFDPDAEGLRTVDQVNYGDFDEAAGELIQSMLASGSLDSPGLAKHEDGKVILALEDVENMTKTHVRTKVLTDKVRIALNKTGKVLTTTAVKFGAGGPEDTGTREVRKEEGIDPSIMEDNPYQATVRYPDLSLSGSVIQMSAAEGRTRENVLIFKLTLTDLRSGLAIWEDESPIGKRQTKPLLGG